MPLNLTVFPVRLIEGPIKKETLFEEVVEEEESSSAHAISMERALAIFGDKSSLSDVQRRVSSLCDYLALMNALYLAVH